VAITQSGSDSLSPADLDANKAGRLSDSQRKGFTNLDRSLRKDQFALAATFLVIAVVLFTANGPAPNAWARPVASAALAVLAIVFLLRALTLGDSLLQDLRGGRVETIEGALGKRSIRTQSGGSSSASYFFDVSGRSFGVGERTYETAPEAGIVRLYFLPRSHKVVNFERLPDRPLPADIMTSPAAAISNLATAFRSHDRVQAAEARAQMAAVKDAFEAGKTAMFAKPPSGPHDPRPLAEAILGTWQAGFVSITFMPDGTMVASFGPRQQHGHWSVGPDGRLRSDATGSDQVADAFVTGDTLSITDEGQSLSLQRAAN
jgi:hypothetical protein